MVQKNTECCLYLLVSWMAITFLMSLKYVFFVSSSLFPPEHGSKSLVPRNTQNQSFRHLPSKKNIDTKTHHVYIICPRETMDFPKI